MVVFAATPAMAARLSPPNTMPSFQAPTAPQLEEAADIKTTFEKLQAQANTLGIS
jgi:hypothetical protein